jgi:hypothetical protein
VIAAAPQAPAAQDAYAFDSEADIARAQFSLDHQPDESPYWNTRAGQDDLAIIADHGLIAATTAQFARDWYAAQMRAAQAAE